MKKTILITLIGLSTSVFASEALLTQVKLDEIKKSTNLFQNPNLTIKKGKELTNTYFLQVEAKGPRNSSKLLNAFVDKSNGDVFLGGGYDKNGKKYTFPVFKDLSEKAVAFSYGTGSKEIFLITDPECPYCIKFAKDSEGKLKDYKVNVILMPLAMHKNANAMVNYIIKGKDNADKLKRYHDITINGSTAYSKEKIDTKLLEAYVLKSKTATKDLNVNGTPSFFKTEGKELKRIQWTDLIKFEKPVQKTEFDINEKQLKDSVAISYGNGSKEIYVVTDPECPYCIKFARDSKGKLNDYKVNVIFMPLSFHKNAKSMVSYILEGKDNTEKVSRYNDIVLNAKQDHKTAKVNDKALNEYLQNSSKTVKELQVKGTPSFFIKENGKLKSINAGALLDNRPNTVPTIKAKVEKKEVKKEVKK